MRYWECVARGLQSRVLRQVTNKLSKALIYAFKHPLKTCWYILRVYVVLLLAGLCLTFITTKAIANDIYELASGSVDAGLSSSCDTRGVTPSDKVSEFNTTNNLPKDLAGSYTGAASLTSTNTEWASETQCRVHYSYEYEYYRKANDGSTFAHETKTGGWYISGTLQQVPTCPPRPSSDSASAFPDHRLLHTLENGTSKCFTSQALEDADTCDINNPDVLGTVDSPSLVCLTKDDGSKCAMQKYEVNGQFAYSQNLEPSSCYEGEIALNPYENPATTDITGDECQALGNGIRACPSDPSEVCNQSTGVCNTGCGTFDIGNGPVFVCLQDELASCDPTTTASCSNVQPPNTPIDEPYQPPITIDDPQFTTTAGTNTLITSTNQILTGVNQGVATIGTGMQGVKNSLDEIKDELETSKTITFDNDIYTPNDYNERNYGTVLEDAVSQMQQTELVQSINTFFDVEFSGSCPVYSTAVPYINTTITIDQFCSPVMTSMWPIVSSIMILVFSVLAFRVAVL